MIKSLNLHRNIFIKNNITTIFSFRCFTSITNKYNKLIETSNGKTKEYKIDSDCKITELSPPPHQHQTSLITNEKKKGIEIVKRLFLPSDYPNSVSKDYLPYQKWMFAQNVLGSATYVLSTHALLSSVGVSSSISTTLPFAAAIAWVLKDGLGATALVLFASRYSSLFDFDLKKYKFRGDILHNLGVLLEMCTPFLPGYFLVSASISNLSKGLAGLIYGSTRASLNRSFSKKENLGDITAKYQSQSMAAYLTGMAIGSTSGILLNDVFSHLHYSPHLLNIAFVFNISMIHLYCGYRALKSVQLKTLNKKRATIIIENWIQSNSTSLMTIEDVNNLESFILSNDKYSKLCDSVHLGSSIKDAFPTNQGIDQLINTKNGEYVITHHSDNIYIVYYENSDTKHRVLKSYFHALWFLSKNKIPPSLRLCHFKTKLINNFQFS
ncbi:DUF647 family protein [Tieghemostelium lacteum]|uniref:DUF647 family protein n=1 Tax=Tieghemostelium lacteum TaxID=361077 RepID=A0A152A1S8_TIELA|nr:DUF647 family protein [Tieghemostelium lacteum]|eukprot:KYR00164.1 DUF647 family protein [Tieghemostelium lacteum]